MSRYEIHVSAYMGRHTLTDLTEKPMEWAMEPDSLNPCLLLNKTLWDV